MKQNTNNLVVLMGSYHQAPVTAPAPAKSTPSVGDKLTVDRWNAGRGGWDQVLMVWDGAEYVKK
jgi:hypothetical protein